jgi:predicted RNase H-like HicB family nuclease
MCCESCRLRKPKIESTESAAYNVNMPDLNSYTIVIKPDDNDTYVAYVPAIPGCHAVGRTSAEAQAALADVFAMIAEEYEEEKRQLPPDVPLKVASAG